MPRYSTSLLDIEESWTFNVFVGLFSAVLSTASISVTSSFRVILHNLANVSHLKKVGHVNVFAGLFSAVCSTASLSATSTVTVMLQNLANVSHLKKVGHVNCICTLCFVFCYFL